VVLYSATFYVYKVGLRAKICLAIVSNTNPFFEDLFNLVDLT